jgi:Predicted Permease Membrane Region
VRTGAALRRTRAGRCHQQGLLFTREFAFRAGAWFLAERPLQIAFHEAPLGPVHGGTADCHGAGNLLVAAAGRRQQYLSSLELTGGVLAPAHQGVELTALSLASFVALTGLHAGPIFFPAVGEAGIGLLFGGIVGTLLPLVVGLYFGHYVLRMNPIMILGGLAGAQTMTAAMAAVQDRSGSPVAVLGFTPAVPIGHILLTTWGAVIVGVIGQ